MVLLFIEMYADCGLWFLAVSQTTITLPHFHKGVVFLKCKPDTGVLCNT